jgi:hypothetical protein
VAGICPSNPRQKQLEQRLATQVFPRPRVGPRSSRDGLYGDITGVGDGFTPSGPLRSLPKAKCGVTSTAQRASGRLHVSAGSRTENIARG